MKKAMTPKEYEAEQREQLLAEQAEASDDERRPKVVAGFEHLANTTGPKFYTSNDLAHAMLAIEQTWAPKWRAFDFVEFEKDVGRCLSANKVGKSYDGIKDAKKAMRRNKLLFVQRDLPDHTKYWALASWNLENNQQGALF